MINVKSGWTNLDKFWNCGHIGKEISTLDETVYRKCITPPRLGDFSEIRGMNHGQSCPFRRFPE